MRTVLKEYVLFDSKANRNRKMISVECSCGKVDEIRKDQLKNSTQCKSCRSREISIRHGMHNTRIYTIWSGMKNRCGKHSDYLNVSYQDSWSRFENFYNDMADGYSDELSLDRKDPFGNYTKDNCRWATDSVQASNIKGYAKHSRNKNIYPNKEKWMVRFMRNGVMHYIGTFDTIEDAVIARDIHFRKEK